jgi:hypothetical protein
MTDLYVLEWSQKQGMPHVQRLEQTLSCNRRAYRENAAVGSDYIPIAVGTFDEMLASANAMRGTLASRKPEKAELLYL